MAQILDILFTNGHIHSLRTPSECFSCMGIRGEKIEFLAQADVPGTPGSPDRHGEAGTSDSPSPSAKRTIDLKGAHVWPALIDAHLHLLYTVAVSGAGFPLCRIADGRVQPDNLTAIEKAVREHCAGRPANDIVVASNYIASAIAERRLPTKDELDSWGENRRVTVLSFDGHSSAHSSAMLKAIGIEPSGHTGQLTGLEHETHMGRMTDLISRTTGLSQLAKGLAQFTNDCAQYGIGCVCALDGVGDSKDDGIVRLLAFLARRLPIGVRLFPQFIDTERAAAFFKLQRHPRIGGCGDWEMDGSVGSHSAAFYEPYADTGLTAPCYYEQAEVDAAVKRAVGQGCQTSAHAIGTVAIDHYLAALCKAIDEQSQEAAEKDAGTPLPSALSAPPAPLHRIDHFEFPSHEAVQTVCDRGDIAVTVQPGYPWVDTRYLKCYEQYLPAQIVQLEAPLKTLVEAGVCVCGSSDAPVQDIDPFLQMVGMVEPLFEEQRLTPFEALQTYTINPARMLGEQDRLGTLECGKQASFFMTEEDLLRLEGSALAGTRAQQTWVDGHLLTKRDGSVRELLALLLKRPKGI